MVGIIANIVEMAIVALITWAFVSAGVQKSEARAETVRQTSQQTPAMTK